MSTAITQAMIAGVGPSSLRIQANGDYYFAEPLFYPWPTGIAIQNDTVGARIRINCNGFTMASAIGPGTQAVGIAIVATPLDLIDGAVEGFKSGVVATCYPGALHQGGQHRFSNFRVLHAFQQGIEAQGHENLFDKVLVRQVGGGSVEQYRPVGIRNMGRRPQLVHCSVLDMVKGNSDIETMNYHLEDADAGFMVDCIGANATKQSGSYGMWFNSLNKSFQIRGGKFFGVETIFGGDLTNGELRVEAHNYDNGSNLVGPVVTIT